MANVAHKDLTGVDLHEPKGVAAATSGQVYVADGAGSGVWQDLVIPSGLFNVTVAEFISGGTWIKPADLFMIKVYVIGKGGSSTQTGGTVSFGSHCSATGGGRGNLGVAGTAGTGSNGDINLTGNVGVYSAGVVATDPGAPGTMFGNKGAGQATSSGGAGGGGAAIKFIPAASLGATETVTFNAGGQNNGYVLVEQYISV